MVAKRKKRKSAPRKSRKRRTAHKRPGISMEEERTLYAKEQTLLSKERTILSFMRTGLTLITVGFALIAASEILGLHFNIQPMAAFVIGWSVILIGLFEIVESFRRLRAYRQKMKEVSEELGEENV